ncbi:MAG: hypothetical protein R3A78_08180 [Polyangiales bacterium]|nr:hypothetical protein [Myxococcales bacterium]
MRRLRWIAPLAFLPFITVLSACSEDGSRTTTAGYDGGVDGDASGDGGGGHTPGPIVRSGSRLKAQVVGVEGDDGVFVAWFDTELDVPCAFDTAEDGKLRCLPTLPGNSPIGHTVDSCDDTPIVINFRPECAEAAYLPEARPSIDGVCSTPIRMYEVDERTAPNGGYYDGSPDFCDGPRELPEGATYGDRGDAMPATAFVPGERVIDLYDGGFGVEAIEAEDGARAVTQFIDDRYGPCSFRDLSDGSAKCVPTHIAFTASTYYEDASCTTELAYAAPVADAACSKPVVAALKVEFAEQGPPRYSAWKLGSAIGDSETVYAKSGENCTASTLAVEREAKPWLGSLYRVSATPLPMLTFETVTRGEGNPKVAYAATSEGIPLQPGVFVRKNSAHAVAPFQLEGGAFCSPRRTTSGPIRCVPSLAAELPAYALRYTDAACTMPIGTPLPGTLPPEGAPTVMVLSNDEGCPISTWSGVEQAWTVGDAYTGAAYDKVSDDCVLGDDAEPGTYRLGDTVLDDFPELTLRLL